MPLEKKHFFGGMNQDIEDRFLSPGEYRYALNIRCGSSENADIGAITNTRGNTLITYTLPSGTNTVIGAYEDNTDNNSRVLYFVYNSNGDHQILEYLVSSNTIALVLETSLLNFSPAFPIWHIDLVDNDLLLWTDNYNEPCRISIKRAKETLGTPDGYPSPFSRQYLDAIQYPPLCPPKGIYTTVENVTTNTLKGRLYQLKYRFVYKDNSKSTWSPISKIILPPGGQAQYNNADITENNCIVATFTTGDELVKSIDLAARETLGIPNTQKGNIGDFFLIKSFNKEEEEINSNTTKEYSWLNDSIYSSINLLESNRLYDRVPIKAACQTYTDNRLMYANMLINYDPVSSFQMTAEAILTSDTPGTDGYSTSAQISFELNRPFRDALSPWREKWAEIRISGTISAGDVFEIVIKDLGLKGGPGCDGPITITYMAAAGDTPESVVDTLIADIKSACPTGGQGQYNEIAGGGGPPPIEQRWLSPLSSITGHYRTENYANNEFYVLGHVLSATVTGTDFSDLPDRQGFKRGAVHEFGVVYSDEKGRTMAVQADENSSVYVDWYNADLSSTGAVNMKLRIFSKPPIWASKYRIVYSKNQTVDKFIQYTTNHVTSQSGKTSISLINLKNDRAENENLVLDYEFISGDRIRFIKDKNGDFYANIVDVEILSYDTSDKIIIETIDTALIDDLGPDMLFEIYTPKKTLEDKFFFEIGECLEIGNPYLFTRYHKGKGGTYDSLWDLNSNDQNLLLQTPAVIDLYEGDVYYKLRSMGNSSNPGGSTIIEAVEDYNFSDFYNSNSISVGRPNIIDEGLKQTEISSTVFMSEVFIPNTNINGLGSFYGYSYPDLPPRAKDYDKRAGSIQKLYSEDKKLNLFQELKVGRSLVGESVIFDQSGVPTISKATDILSDIIYYPGEYGIGNEPGSFGVYGHTKYFSDMKRGVMLSLSRDTLEPISRLMMHNYFTDIFKEMLITKATQDVVVKNTLLGIYDIKFSEYVISLRHKEHPVGSLEKIPLAGTMDNALICVDALVMYLGLISVGDTLQITLEANHDGFFVIETFEIVVETIVGNCFAPALFYFDHSLYPIGIPVTIYNMSSYTYKLTFDPQIEPNSALSNDFTNIDELNITYYNRATKKDTTVSSSVTPTSDAEGDWFLINGADIPLEAVNDGDTVTLFDYDIQEYEITDTLSFNAIDQRWKTFYSFFPEMMVQAAINFVTFKEGSLFLHNSNDVHNNFYGNQFTSEIEAVSNEYPSLRKVYLSMVQESNKAWKVDNITNQLGQQSSLIEGDFENIEGDFYAEFLKDKNTPVTNSLIEGEDLRSHELKMKMVNEDTGAVKLFSIGFNYASSERTNK